MKKSVYTLYILALIAMMASCRSDAAIEAVPVIHVGIMRADSLSIREISAEDGRVVAQYNPTAGSCPEELTLSPSARGTLFEVDGVTIGIGFHWEQKETQRLEGSLRVVPVDGTLQLINDIDIERYLESVISSEMSARAPRQLLMAHAVTSRSWLLSQISHPHSRETRRESGNEITVWYDRDDHELFDVCADDHCQRYQGVTRLTDPTVVEAVRATRGLVLTDGDGTVCDARFSKCCGGVTEEFENCWEPEHHGYLEALCDSPQPLPVSDLTVDSTATAWIEGRPDAFCTNPSTELLAVILNSYDRATKDYYRWEVSIDADSLGRLVAAKSGRNLGSIRDLIPLERGRSGRITRLLIAGSRDSLTVGKELEIRRLLSPSHLYSSAFTVARDGDVFTLHGAGWGHGVGLCQIGAAVMAAEGYGYKDILKHYFTGATLEKAW